MQERGHAIHTKRNEMRILRFNMQPEPVSAARTGVLLGDMIGDLRAGHAACLAQTSGDSHAREIAAMRLPPNINDILNTGGVTHAVIAETVAWLAQTLEKNPETKGLAGEPLFSPLATSRLHAPIRPSKLISVNQGHRLRTMSPSGGKGRVPSCTIKTVNTIIGPQREVTRPSGTSGLDYETKLVVVIGKKCKNVTEDKALDVVFGYQVANDIVAPEVMDAEAGVGGHLLSGLFDSFCPMGPWVVTRDEVPDPAALKIRTAVNGETVQQGSVGDMDWSLPELIAYVSRMTLEPGDMIMTGIRAPAGVAGRRMLNPGDLLVSEIAGLGELRNKILEDNTAPAAWKW
jgi:2-keto-4-pentenoate hydratase/2-oxohepta-3-ene-1,7-dioic acid hydratase in catechol pathway